MSQSRSALPVLPEPDPQRASVGLLPRHGEVLDRTDSLPRHAGNDLADAQVITAALAAAVSHAGRGGLVLCGQQRLLYANEVARSCLGPHGPLSLRQGRLEAAGAAARQAAEALSRLERSTAPQFFTLYRPARSGDQALPAQRFAATARLLDLAARTPCHVIILDPLGDQQALEEQALARWLGLTPAQARVASCLSQGLTPESAAARCGRSIATVRTQIRAILERSGIDSLQQLYRALAALGRGAEG